MRLSISRSSRYCKSLSSLLSWSAYSPISPIIYVSDDEQFEQERRRELQRTLDKLEGRFIVATDEILQQTHSEDETSNNVCGLMSMLSNQIIDVGATESRVGGDDPDYSMITDAGVGYGEKKSHKPEDYNHRSSSGGDKSSSQSTATGDLAMLLQRDTTHPAFSWLPEDDSWETSSRVSDDSFFDGHSRQAPEPPVDGAGKPIERFSKPFAEMSKKTRKTATVIPFYRDSLCTETISDTWLQTRTELAFFEENPSVDISSTSVTRKGDMFRMLSCIPRLPRNTTSNQAVFHAKPSFMKRIIKNIVKPMKIFSSRKKNSANLLGKDKTNRKTPEEYPESDGMAESSHSSTSKRTAQQAGFNDTVGYRVFREEILHV